MNFLASENSTLPIRLRRIQFLCLLAIFSASMAFGGCASVTSAADGPGVAGQSSRQPVSLSPASLAFGNQNVGTQSAAQVVTLTNSSPKSIGVSSITASVDFSQSNNCGTSIAAGKHCAINVTFRPTVAGSVVGSLTIRDNVSANSLTVSLSGTGANPSGGGGQGGGGGSSSSLCAGTVLGQSQTDVTSQLSFVNTAAAVKVSELTNNGANRFYYFDVPAYSSAANQIVYTSTNSGNVIVSAKTDGTSSQQVSPTNTGTQAFLSPDGKLLYYDKGVPGGTPGGADIYGMFLNTTGPCSEFRITNLDVPPKSPLPVWEISGASPDASGGYDIAFSPDTLVHRVHVKTDGTTQMLSTVTLNDPESAGTFHRLRLNPKFPNIVMYKRNSSAGTTADPEVWVADLNTCANNTCSASQITNIVAKLKTPSGQQPKGGHINWSPDGLDILFSEPDIANYWIARNVVNSNGTFNPNFTLQQLGPFTSPFMTADYCAFPPNWPSQTILACLAGPASPANPKTLYLMSSDGKGTIKLLTATDAPVLTIGGTPMPQFAQDGTHLMFNSDRTGVAQIYMVSGFTLSVP